MPYHMSLCQNKYLEAVSEAAFGLCRPQIKKMSQFQSRIWNIQPLMWILCEGIRSISQKLRGGKGTPMAPFEHVSWLPQAAPFWDRTASSGLISIRTVRNEFSEATPKNIFRYMQAKLRNWHFKTSSSGLAFTLGFERSNLMWISCEGMREDFGYRDAPSSKNNDMN